MISVLMSTYNRAEYLRRAIDSVLSQTYKDLELVIVDDGSTDNSKEVIEAYTDERVKYIRLEQNSFYCYAANYGLKSCEGDYIAFMNSDDEWLPQKLEKQIGFLENHLEYGACFTEAYLIDGESCDITDEYADMRDLFATKFDSRKEWMNYFLRKRNCLCHPSALIRKAVMDQVGGFNLLYCQLADYDLWIRIVEKTAIYVLPERLIRFRWDKKKNDQVSSAAEGNMVRAYNEQIMIWREMIERLSDEQFVEFFGDSFINKESSTHLQIEFEKAFLLTTCMKESSEWKVLGIEKLDKVLREPEAMEVLREHFKMSIFDIYEWNKTHMYCDPWILGERQSQKMTLEQQKQELEMYKKQLQELLGSTSWKITEPLRKIMHLLKK